MKKFEFTLVLPEDPTIAQSDLIAERIPTIHSIDGGLGEPSEAHFTVDDADTFIDAVTASVRQLEDIGIQVLGLGIDDEITLDQIALRTGRQDQEVRALASGEEGPGGFPQPDGLDLYPWDDVARWFEATFPMEQDFELDEQADAMNHILRARRFLRDHADDPTWITLFNA